MFQCFFCRIFATTLKKSDLRVVATWLKEDNSAKSWRLSIATSVSEKNEKLTPKKFSAPGHFTHMNEASLSDTILHTRREGQQAMRSPSSINGNPTKWQKMVGSFA